jgi:hypothetical protein
MPGGDFPQHFEAFLNRKQRLLALIPQERNNQPINQPARAFNQIQVSVRYGIERTGVDGY